MKNYERYANEIRKEIGKDEGKHFCSEFIMPYILKVDSCGDIPCHLCHMLQTIWLLEDYEESEIDWSKVEVDTPILVRDDGVASWLRRHFAKYENGLVYAWKDSRTSWTTWTSEYGSEVTAWKHAKLAESEEE